MEISQRSDLICHDLDSACQFFTGLLPNHLNWNGEQFDGVWKLHPPEKHVIMMPGGPVETPRWQQAYGADYHYTGRTNRAIPVPAVLEPLRDWAQGVIEPRLNGLLLNWYEGPTHYIGPHHDSTRDMVPDTPIVTISFGETRIFRLTKGKGDQQRTLNFPAPAGTVFVMPWTTNLDWKHSVPKSARFRGRRISVTIRAFFENEPSLAKNVESRMPNQLSSSIAVSRARVDEPLTTMADFDEGERQ